MNNIHYWHDFWVVSEILAWLLYMCVALWRSAYCALPMATPWTTQPSGQALDIAMIDQNGYSIESVVLSVKHNGMQIILKTGIGGAPLISRMLDSMGESAGILGTLAGDDTIFIAPVEAERIEEISQSIRTLLGVNAS